MEDTGTTAVATPAPTPSTPAPTPSPAPTAASPSIDPGQRPRSVTQAFAQDTARLSPAPVQPEAATTQPTDASDPTSAINPSPDTGPIPFAAHKTALDNARTKAVAEYREKFGWAESVPREAITSFAQTAQRMTSDPVGFVNDFVRELQAHPTYGPQLRSQAGRTLAAGRTAPVPQAEPQPDVEIVNEHGQVTGRTFSDKALAARDAFREQQLLAKVEQRFGPLKTADEQRAKQAQIEARDKKLNAHADGVMAEVMDILDGDKAHLAAVDQAMKANPTWSAHKAALHVRKTVIAPAAAGKAQSTVLDTLKTKAAAQAVNPSGAVVATTTRPRSFLDKNLSW